MLELKLHDRVITTGLPAFVMGIVNCTPDSFFEKSRGESELAEKLIQEGADILDIGGESTRPGSAYIDAEEEIRRVVPVIEKIRKISDIPVSVDTRKSSVMKACFDAGADIVNDISALEDDVELGVFAAEKKLPVILMHKKGNPDIMQKKVQYNDTFREVNDYLTERASYAESLGIGQDKIILDPGIGFGKHLEDNISLIKNCGKIGGGKYRILMALSRKTCIGEMTGRSVDERLYGTLAADIAAVLNGASLLRVHDVGAAVDTLKVLKHLYSGE